jgi:hypothetical protein
LSHYAEVKTVFKDKEALLAALQEVTVATGKWTAEMIEVHSTPQNLYGYIGDMRQQKADIIIRRKNVQGSANDIGFVKKADGSYEAIISDYDRGFYNDAWLGKLTQEYNVVMIHKLAKQQGHVVTKVERMANGQVKVRTRESMTAANKPQKAVATKGVAR